MARAYQESHILDNLSSSLKTLQAQTAELVKTKGLQEEKITNLQKQNAEQAKKIGALETRTSANEHNTTARLLNAHAYHTRSLHAPLTPLHDLSLDRPIRHFPKHEKDIKTMGASEVIQVLQALDVKTLSMSASEKKGELRAQVGLPREVETAASAAPAAVAAGAKAEEMKSDGKVAAPAKKTLPKVAPGSTAEKAGTVGTGAAKGVSKPAGKEVGEKKP